jgi:menaquinone-9 beta-reductase
MNKSHDIIVVGGGPAGCSSAVHLASHGYDVLLLEKNRFPRDKVCGDGLSPPALEVQARLGVYQKIMDQNSWEGVSG